MSVLREYEQHPDDRPVTWNELRHLEGYLDSIWKHLGIDFEFTKHFFERINDPRNKRQITAAEIAKMFSEVYKKYGKMIAGKVTPETEKTFDSVLTDLSTKVNSPVIVAWDKQAKELKMICKTVMRVNHFYTHPDQPRLTVQQFQPTGQVIAEKKMQKTYQDLKEWLGLGLNTPEVAQIAAPQAVDDVDTAAFAVEQPDVLDKINGYCHGIANHQYLNPYYPLNALWKKLSIIGIDFDLKKLLLTGNTGRIEAPLKQYGGRYGALGGDHFVGHDDGISSRVPGGLNLVITYHKAGGLYNLDAQIEHGSKTIGFGESEERIHEEYHVYTSFGGKHLGSHKTHAVAHQAALKHSKKEPVDLWLGNKPFTAKHHSHFANGKQVLAYDHGEKQTQSVHEDTLLESGTLDDYDWVARLHGYNKTGEHQPKSSDPETGAGGFYGGGGRVHQYEHPNGQKFTVHQNSGVNRGDKERLSFVHGSKFGKTPAGLDQHLRNLKKK